MAGGINAWKGLVAEGYPEAGIPWFAAARSVEEIMALAWILEDGTEKFYSRTAEFSSDSNTATLLGELATAEEHHKEMITGLYRDITGWNGDIDFPSLLGRYPQEKIMEGGMKLSDALAWAKGKGARELLELSMSLETGSYDRYLTMQDRINDERSLKIFSALADEEKHHLEKLTEQFERNL
jgi:rubrerythrin